jgi:phytoene dehydrogenase-like protein
MKDVIIIGSGIGGLVAGNLLAKKGHRVTIFEAHGSPGGYTAGFYRNGYYFESGTLAFEASASVFKAMDDIGLLSRIDFVRHRVRFVSDFIDGTPETYEDFKKSIYPGFPAEKERLDAFFAVLGRLIDAMGDMDRPMPFLYSGFKMLTAMLPYLLTGGEQRRLSKQYISMTSSEFVARYFEPGSKLYRLFNGLGYPDMPALFIASSLSGVFADYWTVKGGMQSWADVLAENFRSLGGDLKLNSRVDRIITKNGAAAGVSCNNTVYEADHVIAAADYKKTFLELLDDRSLVPQELRDKIAGAAVSEGIFTVYLGLDMPGGELGKHMQVPLVFTFYDEPGYDIYNSGDAEFFSKASPLLYSPSMMNHKLAPEGKSSLMLQASVPHRWMNNWGEGDRDAYGQLKERAMEALIDGVSRVIPGLRESIAYKDAATPLTYERFTSNSDGATSSWSWNPSKKFYKDTMSVNIDTPVRNLHIGSCWAMQIGGVPGALAAAYMCAKKIR